jgi:glycosyltransferase involved in cell wall biosynthesis
VIIHEGHTDHAVGGSTNRRLSVSVVVCTAADEREALLQDCVRSLVTGTRVPDEILIVVDQNPALESTVARWLPSRARLLRTERQGNSEARNVGIRASTSDVIAFIDDDGTAEPTWLSSLMEPFEASEHVLGAGGEVVPDWATDRRWLPDELLWLVGCTYSGHREAPGPIRNPIGCNMAFRRKELVGAGGFATEFGKRGSALVICDETELGLRLERAYGPGRILYVPTARVHHHVPVARIGWKPLVVRCVSEGLSKGRLHRIYPGAALSTERVYVRRVLLRAARAQLVRGVLKRDRRSLCGGMAILLSLVVTAMSFAVGVAAARRREPGAGASRAHPIGCGR